MYRSSLFSTSLPILISCLLIMALLTDVKWYCGLICIFLMISNVEYLSIHLLNKWMSSSLENGYSGTLPIVNWLICFFALKLYELFIYFDFKIYYKVIVITTVWYCEKNRNKDQCTRKGSPEAYIHSSDFWQGCKNTRWGKHSLSNNWHWESMTSTC